MPAKINKVRYKYVRLKIKKFITEHKINLLPVDPIEIINKNGWTLQTYKFYAAKLKKKLNEIIDACGSKDAFTVHRNGLYSIAYNDDIWPFERIRFSLMHEIGHIYLKHLEEFEQTILIQGGLTDREYKILEREANIFASEILAPSEVLIILKWWKNPEIIAKYCKLSKEAAKVRASELLSLADSLVSINSKSSVMINFHNFIYQKKCHNCNFGFVDKLAKYCPICGDKLNWGEGEEMIYEGYELNEKGKAIICPKCENEEISNEGDYCKICGTFLINKCADKICYDSYSRKEYIERESCGAIAEGNARFCIHCGNPTTFLINELLKPWDAEKAEKEAAVSSVNDDDIPF